MKSERALENWLCREVERRGGRAIKLTGLRGLPDRLLLLPGGRAVFVELKRPDGRGRASTLQRVWINRLRALGFEALISDSREQLLAILDNSAK